ncbi:MAG: NAD(P)-dependent oxidoreductase [Cellvibrionaceae bacterium]
MTLSAPNLTPLLNRLNTETSEIALGFIGMGLMGIPMSRRLHSAGFDLQIWNRDQQKLGNSLLNQLTKAESLQALCNHADVIMLCISDTLAVKDLLFGSNGIAPLLRPDQLIIDFSSISPDSTREFSQQLLNTRGTHWVDAPVSGGVAGAENGNLAIMAGGDQHIIEAVTPLLAPLAHRITRMGEVGSGQATKVCNQMLVSCNIAVIAEVLAMAEKAGVDSSLIPTALQGGFADSIPLQISGARMANRELEDIKWTTKTLLKDLQMAAKLGNNSNAQTPMSELAKSILTAHADAGFLELDPATLIKRYTE